MATLIISILALFVSGWSAYYSRAQNLQARRVSITDDYWLRTVIGPVVIEPLVKTINGLIAECPSNRGAAGFNLGSIRPYHDKYLSNLSALSGQIHTLSLISPILSSKVAASLDELEDLMITYCASNEINGTLPLSSEGNQRIFQASCREHLMNILEEIKSVQLKL